MTHHDFPFIYIQIQNDIKNTAASEKKRKEVFKVRHEQCCSHVIDLCIIFFFSSFILFPLLSSRLLLTRARLARDWMEHDVVGRSEQ